jgi:uncharacterized protein YciW
MTRPRRSRRNAPPIAPELVEAIPGWTERRVSSAFWAAPDGSGRQLVLLARMSSRETLGPAERYAAAIRAAILKGNPPLAESYRQGLRQVRPGIEAPGFSREIGRMEEVLASVDRLVAFPDREGFDGNLRLGTTRLELADLAALARIVALVSYQAAFPSELRPLP